MTLNPNENEETAKKLAKKYATIDSVPMSVIEDIREEIGQILDTKWSVGLYQALRIIDKHIGKGTE